MSYVNGKEILPDNILSEIRKYYSGGLIYIPLQEEKDVNGVQGLPQKNNWRREIRKYVIRKIMALP